MRDERLKGGRRVWIMLWDNWGNGVNAKTPPLPEAHSGLGLGTEAERVDSTTLGFVMQRNHQRLFRAAWRIVGNREDAEDAVQSAYLSAIAAIGSFEGRATLSTWLTRIVINAALAQARSLRRRRVWLEKHSASLIEDYNEYLMRGSMSGSPEHALACRQIKRFIDDAIDRLPAQFRTVFVLRQIEECDVGEVAQTLGINTATVKTRHFRARRRLHRAFVGKFGSALSDILPFAGEARDRSDGRSSGGTLHGA